MSARWMCWMAGACYVFSTKLVSVTLFRMEEDQVERVHLLVLGCFFLLCAIYTRLGERASEQGGEPVTHVKENARLELMRMLAMLEDLGRGKEHWPAWTPLFECEADEEGEWENERDDIILAMHEAAKLGHIKSRALHTSPHSIDRFVANLRKDGRDWMVSLTPEGSSWIRAHDALGEVLQERGR